jgi:hypothetical protein
MHPPPAAPIYGVERFLDLRHDQGNHDQSQGDWAAYRLCAEAIGKPVLSGTLGVCEPIAGPQLPALTAHLIT